MPRIDIYALLVDPDGTVATALCGECDGTGTIECTCPVCPKGQHECESCEGARVMRCDGNEDIKRAIETLDVPEGGKLIWAITIRQDLTRRIAFDSPEEAFHVKAILMGMQPTEVSAMFERRRAA